MSAHQLIDAHGVFTSNPPPSSPETRSYTTIAVVGCQSGGKSTLLNRAFDTAFPVLNASKSGRRRTTLGIWTAIHNNPPDNPHVILDVEGTDSRERGEGAKAFESRTTLFALALADVVVVNMWAHDVGRYSAANYELFETVFAHAVALRKSAGVMAQKPVRVLIVVRDHDGESLVSDIRRVLMGDLLNIWESLKVKDLHFEELFQMDVFALPHLMYASDEFDASVKNLRENLCSSARRDEQMVPLSGFDALAKTVWSAICRSTGGDGGPNSCPLDLPKHAALAAHFKIGEVVSSIFDGEIGVRIDDLRTEIESEWRKPVDEFGVRIDAIARDALSQFESGTAAYRGDVAKESVTKRKIELGSTLVTKISDLRYRYLSVCRDICMNGFEDDFRPMLGGTNGYERNAKRLAKSYVAKYKALSDVATMPQVLEEYKDLKVGQRQGQEDDMNGVPEMETEVDPLDAEYGLLDDDDDLDEFSCERFKRDVSRMVDERKRMGELMLPGAGVPLTAGPKQDPWWKGLLIRGVILLINYLQATQGQRAAIKLHRKHEKEFPPGPSF